MTVSSSTSRVQFNGNGSTTVFAYSFKIFDQDDLTVIVRSATGTETVKTITTHYTVSGVGNAGGGNVTMLTAPASGETLTILREQDLVQELDLVENDPFPAQSLEDALDKLTFIVQQHDEELGRSIKASRTNTIGSTEFTVSAADRASKIFAFNSSGELSVAQELGTYRGNWATSTAFAERDIVKDTSNNNIYICVTAHTSTGSQPISSNADVAKWALLVDAASATTSASAAASSASAAATSATNAANSATAASGSASAASSSASAASTSETNAAASAASAAASFDAFDDIYLGSKSSDPSVDNDGNALTTGDQYFNSVANELRIWNGSTWQAASTVGGTVSSLSVTGDVTIADKIIHAGDTNTAIRFPAADTVTVETAGSERLRVDSSGNVGIGTSSPAYPLHVNGRISYSVAIGEGADTTLSSTGTTIIHGESSTWTVQRFYTGGTERARIDSSGNLSVGTTGTATNVEGHVFRALEYASHTNNGDVVLIINRGTNDGQLMQFRQDDVQEGNINVSGTTVSYVGGHLSRWAQFPDNSRPELLKGTVMSNLDQMSNWDNEDNEQLNCVQVSTVEGDANVAGVFVAWDSTEDDYNDILLAMTGDMVIRIAGGTTVQRGDLLMSAGDGTAKPQGDDIVRSKTIAKVTSTHVSHTYEDGSYAVPCVLMAC